MPSDCFALKECGDGERQREETQRRDTKKRRADSERESQVKRKSKIERGRMGIVLS